MIKFLNILIFLLISIIFTPQAFAQSPNFVSIVNPVRGNDFWELKDQSPETAVLGKIEILKRFNLGATWLVRFDALENQGLINTLKERKVDEKGIFLEITPRWTNNAGVNYNNEGNWHAVGSAFLSGYDRDERERLIDAAFEKFKNVFGDYPKSVGAWWVDAYSLSYMKEKYEIVAALIVADQYTTDNYQIWGQYWSTPYYPSKRNALHPPQSADEKINIVMMQWAARDPLNAYGNGVQESTYSVQANDYLDYHNLDTNYFSKLVDIYTKQPFNSFGHLVVGLENSYSWEKYGGEYGNQIRVLNEKSKKGQFRIVTMAEFADWYTQSFPEIPPHHLIFAQDPLGSEKFVIWFMTEYFRAGLFFNEEGSVFRDIRQYIGGSEELCYLKSCKEINFATFATRVLDEVSFGHKWVIDEGKISNFKLNKQEEGFSITYTNEAGNLRTIELLTRDIKIDGWNHSVDGAIIAGTNADLPQQIKSTFKKEIGPFSWSFSSVLSKLIRFIIFVFLVVIIPGLVLTNSITKVEPLFKKLFLSSIAGLVAFTALYYTISLLKVRTFVWIYILLFLILFIRLVVLKKFKISFNLTWNWFNLGPLVIILAGTIFQVIPTFRNGLVYPYGVGFWGPNTHDGTWHLSLINQLTFNPPWQNPIFANSTLSNYHFFYDLLIAATYNLSGISVVDLVFRFYPIIFSLMLGIGTYYLLISLFKQSLKTYVASLFSLYLVYFSGSFGWIVSFLKEKNFSGESAFWANQSISFNLNPPFAISLIIVIAILQILIIYSKSKNLIPLFLLILLIGTLVGFKAYAASLILGSLFILVLINLIIKKEFSYLKLFIASTIVSFFIFVSNFKISTSLFVFSPFWFIHSMIDSPDRVGWVRLSLARTTSFEKGEWAKFIVVQGLSLALFIIGNLGVRIFALGSIFRIKEVAKNEILLFILIFSLLSLIIPILFIQNGNPWNTIQFLYYFLYISALFGGVVIATLLFKLPKLFSPLLVLAIIVLAPINSIKTASGYLNYRPHAYISQFEYQALNFLKDQPFGVVLTYPYDERIKKVLEEPWPLLVYDSTAYVSAFSEKPSFIEDEGQNQILLTDYKKRIIASIDFFRRQEVEEGEFLRKNNIKYIYLPKIFNKKVDEGILNIKNIFENEEVLIFKVK